jgi:hypothetical protein
MGPYKVLTVFSLFLFMAVSIIGKAFGTQISWSNASGGNWSTGSNWSGGIVPGATDTALIMLDGTYTVTLDADTTVAGITLGGPSGRQTFSMTSRTLTVDGPFNINTNGKAYVSSSTINGTGDITVSDTLAMITATINPAVHNSGVITAAGVINLNQAYTNDPGSTLRLWYQSNWGAVVNFASGFTNNGFIELVASYSSAACQIASPNGPVINSPTGTIAVNSTNGPAYITAELDNQGTVEINFGCYMNMASAQHTNSGTINLAGGSLSIDQATSFTNTGAIVIEDGYIFDVNNNCTFNFNSGNISGEGTLDFNYATINWVPAYNWTGSLIMNVCTMTISNDMLIQNRTPVSYSTINGAGNITVTDTLALGGSTIDVPLHNSGVITAIVVNNFNQTYTNDEGSVLHLWYTSNAGAAVNLDSGFTNNGLIELVNTYSTASTSVNCSDGPLVNSATGTILSTGTMGTAYIGAELDNHGTINLEHYLNLNFASAQHTNSGMINITGGNLVLSQSGSNPSFTNTSAIAIDSGYVIDVNNGSFNFPSGSIINEGTIDFSQATASFVPAVNWPGSLILSSSTLTIADSLILGNPTPMYNSTVDGTGNLLVTDTLTLGNSTIDVPLHNSGVISASGSNDFNRAYTNDESSVLRLWYTSNAGSALDVDSGFVNNGLIEMVNTYSTAGTAVNSPNGQIVNSPTGTILNTGTMGSAYIGAELDNQGTIDLEHGLSLNFASANHANSGSFNLIGGSLTISQAASFSNTGIVAIGSGLEVLVNNGNFDNQETGILAGDGTIEFNIFNASFSNAGIINPGMSPGALTIIGDDLEQQPTSVINIEIESTASGDFDSLAIADAAILAGNLNLDLYNGYFPEVGDSIVFLSANSVTGNFDSLDLQIGGIVFDTVSTSDAVALVCIQADNYDPTIDLDSTISFDADNSAQVDLWTAADDPESPDSLLAFGFTTDNDSLMVAVDSSTGVMTLTSDPAYAGTVELVVSVTDPQGGSAADTVLVTVIGAQAVDDEMGATLPKRFVLRQNYPNPFNASTVISYGLPYMSHVTIDVYNILGRKIETLVDGQQSAGNHQVVWKAKGISSGMYFYRIQTGEFTETKKMLLLK